MSRTILPIPPEHHYWVHVILASIAVYAFWPRSPPPVNLGAQEVMEDIVLSPEEHPHASQSKADLDKAATPFERVTTTGNSLGMKFVLIPNVPGEIKVLGCIHETRSRDFAAFIADKNRGYEMTGFFANLWRTCEYNGRPVGRGQYERAQDSSHPVCNVSWEDAKAFGQWLTRKDRSEGVIGPHDEYRLPTDHEWSLMVGIGDQEDPTATPQRKNGRIKGVYPWGASFPPLRDKVGNYGDAGTNGRTPGIPGYNDGYVTTAPVMSFPPNSLGIYDLGGNAGEWCEDWYDDPHEFHVVRGADWGTRDGCNSLSSSRSSAIPKARNFSTGFRCVLAMAGG